MNAHRQSLSNPASFDTEEDMEGKDDAEADTELG